MRIPAAQRSKVGHRDARDVILACGLFHIDTVFDADARRPPTGDPPAYRRNVSATDWGRAATRAGRFGASPQPAGVRAWTPEHLPDDVHCRSRRRVALRVQPLPAAGPRQKGHISGVSADVLDAVARALRLDDAERAYLFDLAAAARPARASRSRNRTQVRSSLQWVVESMITAPAFVRNGRLDLLAINSLGRALYAPVFDDPAPDAPGRPANLARFNFLDPRARDFYPDWDNAAHTSVALLRTEAGRDPHNPT